ncbi:MAG TPA: tautomerase family protein [Acidobacteriaceae bacterium]|jgi:phenylpyruvate tautomerase PptA (4-oxalocrotonate tautomerase family)|nr:tautomerase family protein [Acidobacteriaceae bacterium]
MPTYTVTTAINRLTPRQKTNIAQDITRIHKSVTGAPASFVHVIFTDLDPANQFVGGKPLQHDFLFLKGNLRAGRTLEQKQDLLLQLVQALADAAAAPKNAVWAYLDELPASQMVEFGHTLPQPGTEAEWLNALPPEDRNLLDRIGR